MKKDFCVDVGLPFGWIMFAMKAKTKKARAEVPFDLVLFAASVPGRKPTPKDLEDTKEREDDAIEPQQYDSMEGIDEDL